MSEAEDESEPEKMLNRRRLAWLLGLGIALVAGGAWARSAFRAGASSGGISDTSTNAHAAGVPAAAPMAAEETAAKHRAERYRVKVPGSSVDKGGAKIAVLASSAVIGEVVRDFGSYSSFISQFRKSEVVNREGEFTDVRIEVPILGGLTTVWAVVRFGAPEPLPRAKSGGAEDAKLPAPYALRGRFVRGNLKSLDVAWLVHPTSGTQTRLHLELHMVPKLPVPGSVVSGELESAADTGVTAARDRAERMARERKRK